MRLHSVSFFPALFVLAALTVTLSAEAAHAQRAGDCRSMVAATGGKGIWYGQFSGRYEDLAGWVWPLIGRGCFTSEKACRRWLHEMLNVGDGFSALTSCRPYNQKR